MRSESVVDHATDLGRDLRAGQSSRQPLGRCRHAHHSDHGTGADTQRTPISRPSWLKPFRMSSSSRSSSAGLVMVVSVCRSERKVLVKVSTWA
jgi:hypothetical protein